MSPEEKERHVAGGRKGHELAGYRYWDPTSMPLPLDKGQLSPGTKMRELTGKKLNASIT